MTAQPKTAKVLVHLPITLPEGAEIKTAVDQQIRKGQILAVKAPDQVKCDLASKLKIKASKIDKVIKKNIGDKIEAGETIGEIKTWFKSQKIIVHTSGTISHYESGIMYIQTPELGQEVTSPFAGKIINVDQNRIIIETPAEQVSAHWGWGQLQWGELFIVGDQEHAVDLEKIKGDLSNKIIVFSGELTKGSWHKLSALGAKGIITSQIPVEFELWPTINSGHDSQKFKHPTMVVLDQQQKNGLFTDQLWSWFNKQAGKIIAINGDEKWICITH